MMNKLSILALLISGIFLKNKLATIVEGDPKAPF